MSLTNLIYQNGRNALTHIHKSGVWSAYNMYMENIVSEQARVRTHTNAIAQAFTASDVHRKQWPLTILSVEEHTYRPFEWHTHQYTIKSAKASRKTWMKSGARGERAINNTYTINVLILIIQMVIDVRMRVIHFFPLIFFSNIKFCAFVRVANHIPFNCEIAPKNCDKLIGSILYLDRFRIANCCQTSVRYGMKL